MQIQQNFIQFTDLFEYYNLISRCFSFLSTRCWMIRMMLLLTCLISVFFLTAVSMFCSTFTSAGLLTKLVTLPSRSPPTRPTRPTRWM